MTDRYRAEAVIRIRLDLQNTSHGNPTKPMRYLLNSKISERARISDKASVPHIRMLLDALQVHGSTARRGNEN